MQNRLKYHKYGLTIILCLIIFANAINAQPKSQARRPNVKIYTIKVSDELGAPLSKASVVLGEGLIHTETNDAGEVSFTSQSDREYITISMRGYEPQVLLVSELLGDQEVNLKKSKLFMTTEDDVLLPYFTVKKRHLTGSTSVFKGNILEKYPTTDIRNSLTGLVTGMEVYERDGSPGISAEEKLGAYGASEKVALYSRGYSLMYIIDGVRMDITEMPLDPNEIESVSLVRDIVAKTLYGPAAANGIVFITTKRGKINERILNVNVESGVNMIDRFPEWVSGAEYARLNNLARTNSNLTPLYSDEDIKAFELNNPYSLTNPSVNFRDMLIKNTRNLTRINVSTTGGSDAMQYSAYVGYNGEGDNYKVGANAGYHRINARSNIDIRINEFLKVELNFSAGLSLRNSPNYGWASNFTNEGNAAMTLTEMPSLLNDITNIAPVAYPVYVNNDPSLKSPWYGISPQFGTNPLGNLVKNGYYQESGRSGAINSVFEWDMNNIIPGMKSRTFVDFNTFYLLRIGKAENYTAYRIDPRTYNPEAGISSLIKAWDGVDQTNKAKLHDFYFLNYTAYENLSYEKRFGDHYINSGATFRLSSIKRNGFEEPHRELGSVLTALYSFQDKYSVHGVLNYSGASGLATNHTYYLSPSIGVGWVLSEENFLKNSSFIDFLKIRGEVGRIAYDGFRSPYGYRDRWNLDSWGGNTDKFGTYYSNTGSWIGSYKQSGNNFRTYPNRLGNPKLELEKRFEYNFGVDAEFWKHKLLVELNYYYSLRYDVINTRGNTTPLLSGASSLPAVNYNSWSYRGVELGVLFSDKIGDFKYSLGGNAFTQKPMVEQLDEPNYRNEYQRQTGKRSDLIRGLNYLGRFTSDEDANKIPQYGGGLQVGDLKYEDKNMDGVIDDNDYQPIGNSTPKLYYAMNLGLTYKNVDLTVIGVGRAFYDILLNNKYFTGGSGDNIYSKFVLENIDSNGLGGNYPRLTYYQVANNFKTSGFWLYDGGFFKVQNIELAWNIPSQSLNWWEGIRGVRIFARGANLLTVSKIKDIDPESINSGITNYPLNMTITGGFKLTF